MRRITSADLRAWRQFGRRTSIELDGAGGFLFGELAEHGGVVHIDVSSGELTFDYETTAEMA